jgi:hypothetical protein
LTIKNNKTQNFSSQKAKKSSRSHKVALAKATQFHSTSIQEKKKIYIFTAINKRKGKLSNATIETEIHSFCYYSYKKKIKFY